MSLDRANRLGAHTVGHIRCWALPRGSWPIWYLYMAVIRSYNGVTPDIHPAAFVAETAALIGSVSVGIGSSIWYGATLRGDVNSITVGARTSVQDGSVLHCDGDAPCVVGDDVTIGHNATVHGCIVGNRAVIGIGATVLSRAVIGEDAVVAAGALVREGAIVPPNTLVLGIPAKAAREVSDEERSRFRANAEHYVSLAAEFLAVIETASL
jgi:carbonic anhydrase/acetyltransferase-like protein (isoleucine patch superfamily)